MSIGLSKACIRRSRLLVTTDSGPRHLAVAFGVPLVGLYGPTLPIWGANPHVREVSLKRRPWIAWAARGGPVRWAIIAA